MRLKLNFKEVLNSVVTKCEPTNLNFELIVDGDSIFDVANYAGSYAGIDTATATSVGAGYAVATTSDGGLNTDYLQLTINITDDGAGDNPRNFIPVRIIMSRAGATPLENFDMTFNFSMYDTELDVIARRSGSAIYMPSDIIHLQQRPWSMEYNYNIRYATSSTVATIIDEIGNVVASGFYGTLPAIPGTYRLRLTESAVTFTQEFTITGGKQLVPVTTLHVAGLGTPIGEYTYIVGQALTYRIELDLSQVLDFYYQGVYTRAPRFMNINYKTRKLDGTVLDSANVLGADIQPVMGYDASESYYNYTPTENNIEIIATITFTDIEDNGIVIATRNLLVFNHPVVVMETDIEDCSTVTLYNSSATPQAVELYQVNSDGEEVLVMEEVIINPGESSTTTITVDGIYAVSTKTHKYYRIVDCRFIKCVTDAITNLAQGDYCGCCDDCNENLITAKFDFTSLIAMYQTYYQLMLITNNDLTLDYFTATPILLVDKFKNLACLLEESAKYCNNCGNGIGGCSEC